MNPRASESLGSLASLHLLRAEYRVSLNQPVESEILKGLAAADRALQINPQTAEVISTRAMLFLLRARSYTGKERKKFAQDAEASFLQALKINNSLTKKYGGLLNEARQLTETQGPPDK